MLRHLEALVHLLQLVGMGMRDAKAAHYAVGAESVVILHARQRTEVATHGIPPLRRPVGGAVHHKTLVHPVPHKAALQRRIFLNRVPIITEATHAVAHCVAVLRHDVGATVVVLQILVRVG